MLEACFAFILVEFVVVLILAPLFTKGGKEDLGNVEFVLLMIISSLVATAIAYYYYLMATLDDTCVMFCN